MSSAISEYAEGMALGATTGAIMGVNQSLLHRGIHGGVEYGSIAKETNEFTIWLFSGMDRLEYESVHLTHHAYTDSELLAEEWDQKQADWKLVQASYPNAPDLPFEAFRDPHSPIQEGYGKVLFGNIPFYRQAAQAIVPFLRGSEAAGVPREYWPEQLQEVDLSESWMERNLYHRKNAGLIGQIALGSTIAAARGPRVAAAFMATHISLTAIPGGVINALGHLPGRNAREKLKVFFGLAAPHPDENGSYATNFAEGYEGVVMGEPRHGDHHKNPKNPYLASDRELRRDPTGVLIRKLVERGLARLPVTRPGQQKVA